MEEQPAYGVQTHELPGYREQLRSQLSALRLLIQLGWRYLTPQAAKRARGDRLGGAILEPVLVDHIRSHCRFTSKGATHCFTESAIQSAVQALNGFRATSAVHRNEQAYDLLCLGTSVPQTVEGDTKSFTIDYIDWKNPANNTYHCTAEFKVERIGFQKHYIPDIVLFVNGIPLVVMVCRRSTHARTKQKPVDRAIDQLVGYQARDGIPQLFLFCQLLLALAWDKACYGTTGTPPRFWSEWKEGGLDGAIRRVMDAPVEGGAMDTLLSGPFADVREAYLLLANKVREITEQDRTVYALCRPKRLLELSYKFIIFDAGAKKIARCRQYFTVREILKRALSVPQEQSRPGGVVWHALGSGKSTAMVMLAKSLALHPAILSPKIILVTDRIDLDDQICGTFRACGRQPERATTGKKLVELLGDRRTHVVITSFHKFAVAVSHRDLKQAHRNTFVLVDEEHSGKYSEQLARGRFTLKDACSIAFIGTPLSKSSKENTFAQFGDLFRPAYTIGHAVEDNAIVPLLYEARHVPRLVDQHAVSDWFKKLTLGLTKEQKSELKCKFSTEPQPNKALEKVRMIAWDVSMHFAATYQNTGLKGQLVAPDKQTALRYKTFMDSFGQVTSEVLISAPTAREGEEKQNGPSLDEKRFWQVMLDRFGTEKNYNKQLINAFKRSHRPEIIIVVDKLLTGFDAPCNTVLYLTRKLKAHTLLQAIARVNRLHHGKEYGLILDYSGVLQELDQAIDFYGQLAGYDPADLEDTVACVQERFDQLARIHATLWELFAAVKGAADPEVYEAHLRDDALRDRFYECFSLFARTLALALSSTSFLMDTDEKKIRQYKADLIFFQNLRASASQRYQEAVGFSDDEPRIKKVIDTYVGPGDVEQLCNPINLLDASQRIHILEDESKSTGAKADMIAAATRHVIEQEMDKDPVFYQKFSRLLKEVVGACHAGRLQALEALEKIKDIAVKVTTHTDDDIPQELAGRDMARSYYGCVCETRPDYGPVDPKAGAKIAMLIAERLKCHKIRDWRTNPDVINKMRGEIDDILFDVAQEAGIDISLEDHDAIIDRCIEVTIANQG
jgi:type I restriction enzyme R subunit